MLKKNETVKVTMATMIAYHCVDLLH